VIIAPGRSIIKLAIVTARVTLMDVRYAYIAATTVAVGEWPISAPKPVIPIV
jgi:hypothetical protein